MKKKPKIILWDIEILIDLAEFHKKVMETYDRATMKASISTLISFGYMELGDKKAKCINAWDFPKRWEKSVNDDYEICKAASEILQDADGIVTHYGSKFDLPFLNSRLLYHGLPLVPTLPHIDTCMVARKNLYIHRNRLNTLAKYLGVEEKLENGGWQLWDDVMHRKKSAQKLMDRYCKQDVVCLSKVFEKLRPFIKNIPNHTMYDENEDQKYSRLCPSCGKYSLVKHGTHVTKTKSYQRFRCSKCGSTCRADAKGNNLRSV